jgi:DNA-binding MarR family transcriptional regulator
LLGAAYRVLGLRIVEGVRAAGFPQRAAHSAVFANIDVPAGTRLTVLARRATMTPQAMGELVDDLERLGYVRRVPDPVDRRAKLVVLTPRGRGSVEAAMAVIGTIDADLTTLLGDRGHASMQTGLRKIIATASEPDPDDP